MDTCEKIPTLDELICSKYDSSNLLHIVRENISRSVNDWIDILHQIKIVVVECLHHKYYNLIEEILSLFFTNIHTYCGRSNVERCNLYKYELHPTVETYIECETIKVKFYIELGEFLHNLRKEESCFTKSFNSFLVEKHTLCKYKFKEHGKRLCGYQQGCSICGFLK
jgi:hypothetical protein